MAQVWSAHQQIHDVSPGVVRYYGGARAGRRGETSEDFGVTGILQQMIQLLPQWRGVVPDRRGLGKARAIRLLECAP